MKKLLRRVTLACALVLVAGCKKSPDDQKAALIVVDKEHQIVVGNPDNSPASYTIEPASSVRLDMGNFQFTENGAAVTPQIVQVWDKAPTRYRLSQPIATVVTLSATTLTNVADGSAFAGFKSGHRLMVNIGRPKPTPEEPDQMTYDWVGLIIVN